MKFERILYLYAYMVPQEFKATQTFPPHTVLVFIVSLIQNVVLRQVNNSSSSSFSAFVQLGSASTLSLFWVMFLLPQESFIGQRFKSNYRVICKLYLSLECLSLPWLTITEFGEVHLQKLEYFKFIKVISNLYLISW